MLTADCVRRMDGSWEGKGREGSGVYCVLTADCIMFFG